MQSFLEAASRFRTSRRITLILVVLLVLLLCFPFIATLVLHGLYSRQMMREQQLDARKTAELLLRSFELTVDSVDALMLNFAASYDSTWTPQQIHNVLKNISLPPGVRQIAVVDKAGMPLASNVSSAPEEAPDVSDREQIRVHVTRNAADGDLFISKSMFDQASQNWTIQFTRPLGDGRGRFAGVVAVSYAITDFVNFVNTLRADPDMMVSLVGFDGIARFRATRQTTFDDDMSRMSSCRIVLMPHQIAFRATSPVDGVERVGYKLSSERYPVFINVAYSLRFIQDRMSRFRLALWGTSVGLGCALILLGLLVSRYIALQKCLKAREMEVYAHLRRETEIVGAISRLPDVSVVHVDDAGPRGLGEGADAPLSRLLQAYLASESFRTLSMHLVGPIVHSEHLMSGVDAFDVEMVIVPLKTMPSRTGTGAGRELVIFAVDQTTRRMEESRLSRMLKLASLGEVATELAHEIVQPLAVIRLAAANALNGIQRGLPQEYLGARIERIIQQTGRMNRIIEHMRIFGRKSEERLLPCSPVHAVESALQVMGAHLRGDDIVVAIDCAPRLPRVMCRKNQLEQVFINLLRNARDAVVDRRKITGGDMRGQIRIKVFGAGGKGEPQVVRISVEDNGGGIPLAIIDRVFQPFFTTKPSERGTGLGLSVSFGIVRDHGGNLSVRNGRDGAIFTITLPAEGEPAAEVPSASDRQPTAG